MSALSTACTISGAVAASAVTGAVIGTRLTKHYRTITRQVELLGRLAHAQERQGEQLARILGVNGKLAGRRKHHGAS